jgi:3-(3-hydroxy-phenyl)propionate hydroxylase
VTVVVVGAGPVGVTAALLLAPRGVDVVVLDRYGAIYPQPRAVRLDDVLGDGWAVLTAGGPPPVHADAAGARVLRLGDGPGELSSPELTRWLRGRAVLVRPDRIAAAVSR